MPTQHERQRGERCARDALAADEPGEQRHDDDLEVAEHGREAGADVLDRVVPDDQVDGEEHARGQRRASARAAARGP